MSEHGWWGGRSRRRGSGLAVGDEVDVVVPEAEDVAVGLAAAGVEAVVAGGGGTGPIRSTAMPRCPPLWPSALPARALGHEPERAAQQAAGGGRIGAAGLSVLGSVLPSSSSIAQASAALGVPSSGWSLSRWDAAPLRRQPPSRHSCVATVAVVGVGRSCGRGRLPEEIGAAPSVEGCRVNPHASGAPASMSGRR